MKITHLHIHHFRNLTEISYQPVACNLFVGDNGSGKTSLLESIYLLSRGKSFRHHQPKHYIEHGYLTTTVFAQLDSTGHQALNDSIQDNLAQTVAIEKALDATTQLRLDGQSIMTQSPLAKLLPTLLFEPITLNSLEQGSQLRREILDWLLFHVEKNFHAQWLTYQRLLRQRNNLLKQVKSRHQLTAWQQQELQAWDRGLASHADAIHQLRAQTILDWQQYFDAQIALFLPQFAGQLRLRYSVGFDPQMGLENILAKRLEQDLELGYTRMGSHRADFNVMLDREVADDTGQPHKFSYPATDVLSRGEKKLLMIALRLSQLPLLNAVYKTPLVLLDDITAELDDRAIQLLLNGLKQVSSQLFITSLSEHIIPKLAAIWHDELQVFNVMQGKLTLRPH